MCYWRNPSKMDNDLYISCEDRIPQGMTHCFSLESFQWEPFSELVDTYLTWSQFGIFFLSFILSDMCAQPIKIKLPLSLPSQIQFVFTKTFYGEGSVCVYICMRNTCIHKCIYACTYTGEKKDLLQRQCLFFSKGVNFSLSTSFHILV